MDQSVGESKRAASRGRPFAQGNPGRKPGSKNRSTLLSSAVTQADAEEILRKSVQLAKAGDVTLLKFFLDRMLPRDRRIKLHLPPMRSADDAVEALGCILRAVSEGEISPAEGASLVSIAKAYADAIEVSDLVNRIDALEAELQKLAGA